MSTDPELLRLTMRLWTCGVTVVTCQHNGERSGMTASSFTSISLEPPLILVCLHKQARTTQLIVESKRFAVSLLGAHQENVSAQFAGYTELPEGEDRFYQMNVFAGETGVPLLTDAIVHEEEMESAAADCRVLAPACQASHTLLREVHSCARA